MAAAVNDMMVAKETDSENFINYVNKYVANRGVHLQQLLFDVFYQFFAEYFF